VFTYHAVPNDTVIATTTEYDTLGALVVIYTFDTNSRLTKAENADGSYWTYTAYFAGTTQAQYEKEYDIAGALVQTIEYDAAGVIVKVTLANGTVFDYDAQGRVVKETAPTGEYKVFTYHAVPNDTVVATTKEYTAQGVLTVTYTYDVNSNLTRKDNADGSYWTYTNYFAGTTQAKYVKEYDAAGALVQAIEYTIAGVIVKVTLADGTVYDYDAQGRVVKETAPTGAYKVFAYHAVPNDTLIATTTEYDAAGVMVVTYVFNNNASNRILTKTYHVDTLEADGSTTLAGTVVTYMDEPYYATPPYNQYSKMYGRTLSIKVGTTLETYTYHGATDRVATKVISVSGVDQATYTYNDNAANRMATKTYHVDTLEVDGSTTLAGTVIVYIDEAFYGTAPNQYGRTSSIQVGTTLEAYSYYGATDRVSIKVISVSGALQMIYTYNNNAANRMRIKTYCVDTVEADGSTTLAWTAVTYMDEAFYGTAPNQYGRTLSIKVGTTLETYTYHGATDRVATKVISVSGVDQVTYTYNDNVTNRMLTKTYHVDTLEADGSTTVAGTVVTYMDEAFYGVAPNQYGRTLSVQLGETLETYVYFSSTDRVLAKVVTESGVLQMSYSYNNNASNRMRTKTYGVDTVEADGTTTLAWTVVTYMDEAFYGTAPNQYGRTLSIQYRTTIETYTYYGNTARIASKVISVGGVNQTTYTYNDNASNRMLTKTYHVDTLEADGSTTVAGTVVTYMDEAFYGVAPNQYGRTLSIQVGTTLEAYKYYGTTSRLSAKVILISGALQITYTYNNNAANRMLTKKYHVDTLEADGSTTAAGTVVTYMDESYYGTAPNDYGRTLSVQLGTTIETYTYYGNTERIASKVISVGGVNQITYTYNNNASNRMLTKTYHVDTVELDGSTTLAGTVLTYIDESFFGTAPYDYGRLYRHEMPTGEIFTYSYYVNTSLIAQVTETGPRPSESYYFYDNYTNNNANEIGYRKIIQSAQYGTQTFDMKKVGNDYKLYFKSDNTGSYWFLWDTPAPTFPEWPSGWLMLYKEDSYGRWVVAFDPNSDPSDPTIDWSNVYASTPLTDQNKKDNSLPVWPPAPVDTPGVTSLSMTVEEAQAEPQAIVLAEPKEVAPIELVLTAPVVEEEPVDDNSIKYASALNDLLGFQSVAIAKADNINYNNITAGEGYSTKLIETSNILPASSFNQLNEKEDGGEMVNNDELLKIVG